MASTQELQKIASQVRRDIVRQVAGVGTGHPGGSLGCTDLLVALYCDVMKHDPSFNMEAKGEDVFILSNGHISPVFYSVLARSGYFDPKELATFRLIGSRLQGHPATHEGLPGIRVATGSLGQGISVASGIAASKKLDGDDRWVFCLTGDGEQQEGQVWEAALFGHQYKLDNFIVIADRNHAQIDGSTEEVMSLGDLSSKWAAFGWHTMKMDGNNMEDVVKTLNAAKELKGKGKPIFIEMATTMGQGVDFMMDGHKWHGKAPNEEQSAIAMAQLEETLGDY
jgi:transketolase